MADDRLDEAASTLRRLAPVLTQVQKTGLYGLFKQAKCGDNSQEAPVISERLQFASWSAWKSLHGTSREASSLMYIAAVQSISRGASPDLPLFFVDASTVAPTADTNLNASAPSTIGSAASTPSTPTPARGLAKLRQAVKGVIAETPPSTGPGLILRAALHLAPSAVHVGWVLKMRDNIPVRPWRSRWAYLVGRQLRYYSSRNDPLDKPRDTLFLTPGTVIAIDDSPSATTPTGKGLLGLLGRSVSALRRDKEKERSDREGREGMTLSRGSANEVTSGSQQGAPALLAQPVAPAMVKVVTPDEPPSSAVSGAGIAVFTIRPPASDKVYRFGTAGVRAIEDRDAWVFLCRAAVQGLMDDVRAPPPPPVEVCEEQVEGRSGASGAERGGGMEGSSGGTGGTVYREGDSLFNTRSPREEGHSAPRPASLSTAAPMTPVESGGDRATAAPSTLRMSMAARLLAATRAESSAVPVPLPVPFIPAPMPAGPIQPILISLMASLRRISAPVPAGGDREWTPASTKSGVTCYAMSGGGSGCRGDVHLPFSRRALRPLIADVDRKSETDSQFHSGQVLHRLNAHTLVTLLRFRAFGPTSPREFVILVHWCVDEDGTLLIATTSVTPDILSALPREARDVIPAEDAKFTRAHVYIGGWVLRPRPGVGVAPVKGDVYMGPRHSASHVDAEGCDVTYTMQSDLKGSIPGMIVRLVIAQQAALPAKIGERLAAECVEKGESYHANLPPVLNSDEDDKVQAERGQCVLLLPLPAETASAGDKGTPLSPTAGPSKSPVPIMPREWVISTPFEEGKVNGELLGLPSGRFCVAEHTGCIPKDFPLALRTAVSGILAQGKYLSTATPVSTKSPPATAPGPLCEAGHRLQQAAHVGSAQPPLLPLVSPCGAHMWRVDCALHLPVLASREVVWAAYGGMQGSGGGAVFTRCVEQQSSDRVRQEVWSVTRCVSAGSCREVRMHAGYWLSGHIPTGATGAPVGQSPACAMAWCGMGEGEGVSVLCLLRPGPSLSGGGSACYASFIISVQERGQAELALAAAEAFARLAVASSAIPPSAPCAGAASCAVGRAGTSGLLDRLEACSTALGCSVEALVLSFGADKGPVTLLLRPAPQPSPVPVRSGGTEPAAAMETLAQMITFAVGLMSSLRHTRDVLLLAACCVRLLGSVWGPLLAAILAFTALPPRTRAPHRLAAACVLIPLACLPLTIQGYGATAGLLGLPFQLAEALLCLLLPPVPLFLALYGASTAVAVASLREATLAEQERKVVLNKGAALSPTFTFVQEHTLSVDHLVGSMLDSMEGAACLLPLSLPLSLVKAVHLAAREALHPSPSPSPSAFSVCLVRNDSCTLVRGAGTCTTLACALDVHQSTVEAHVHAAVVWEGKGGEGARGVNDQHTRQAAMAAPFRVSVLQLSPETCLTVHEGGGVVNGPVAIRMRIRVQCACEAREAAAFTAALTGYLEDPLKALRLTSAVLVPGIASSR